jgi:hypothetical protein
MCHRSKLANEEDKRNKSDCMPDRVTFDSSAIAALTYDADGSTLDVEFTNGRIYRYWMISAAVYESFAHSPSLGHHFNSTIRDRFPFRELE